jgi:hypothetical protein
METYTEQKKRHQDEFGAFDGIFFAFSNEQMKEGIEKHGVNENNKIVNIGAGGFVLKSRLQEFKDLLKRQDEERAQLRKDEKELIGAIVYELQNHEYCITGNPDDALTALDLTRDTLSPEILKKAIKKHNELEMIK